MLLFNNTFKVTDRASLETFSEYCCALGKQSSIIYILDLKGLKHDKRLLSLVTGPLKFFSQFMADHYVELIKYFVIVNAPSFMRNIWWIICPLLPERTRNKVRMWVVSTAYSDHSTFAKCLVIG